VAFLRHPFERLRGKVGVLSIPCWKARGRLPVSVNEHLGSCYSWGTTCQNISNSAIRQRGALFWRYIWGWRVSVSPNIYVPLDRGMSVLQLCSWKSSLKETSYQTSFNWSWLLFQIRKCSLFEPPFGGLRGNVRTSSIALWKARIRLHIRHNWTFFFASSYCWVVTGGNLSTWAIFEGGSLRSPIKGGRGSRPPTTVGWQKTRRIALSCDTKISPVGSFD